MIGALLAFASAAFFGLNGATIRRGVLHATALQGMAITVPLGVPLFATIAVFMGGFGALAAWDLTTWYWMTAAGIVHFVIGRYGNYRAIQALGSTLSAPIQQLSLLVALSLAFIFLGETVTGMNVIGIILIMFGPMVILRRRKQPAKPSQNTDFQPDYPSGLLWGAVGAVGYGTSPLFITFGLGQNASMADGAAGVLVSYTAATIVVIAVVMVVGGPSYLAGVDKRSRFWFLITAILVGISQLCRYLALTIAPVSVVMPIQRLSVIFRLLFGVLLNRDHEVIDGWIIATIFVAVVGALALTVESRLLVEYLPLPAGIGKFLAAPLF